VKTPVSELLSKPSVLMRVSVLVPVRVYSICSKYSMASVRPEHVELIDLSLFPGHKHF